MSRISFYIYIARESRIDNVTRSVGAVRRANVATLPDVSVLARELKLDREIICSVLYYVLSRARAFT